MSDEDQTIALSSGAPAKTKPVTNVDTITAPKAKLVCLDSSQVEGNPAELVIELSGGLEQIIGRDEGTPGFINSRKLSRKHARVFPGMGSWGVEDMHSTNGVFVNGRKVATAWLKHGDEVKFGPVVFRYVLDRPDMLTSGPASAHADDDDQSEKTMMVGSTGAAEAVLKAAKAPEPVVAAPPPRQQRAAEAKAPQQKSGGKGGLIAGIAAVILLAVGGGLYFFPEYQRNSQITAVVESTGSALTKIAEKTRSAGPDQMSVAKQDIPALDELRTKLKGTLGDAPHDVRLLNTAAQIEFMRFERLFANFMSQGKFAEAKALAKETLEVTQAFGRAVPKDAKENTVEDVKTAVDLAGIAETIAGFKEFSQKYPKANPNAEVKPGKAEVEAQLKNKPQFVQVKKAYNRALSVTYVIYRKYVGDAETQDLTVIDEWRNLLQLPQGQ